MEELEKSFLAESAITSIDDDAFNFKHYVEKVKNLIQHNSNNPEPIVIGIHGKWGEGKTSFLNLIERKIDLFEEVKKEKGILKFHFNPWRYSTEEEMLFDFFDALSKTMFLNKNSSLKQAGTRIKKFGKYLRSVKISSSVGVFGLANAQISFEPSKIFEALGEDLEGENITLEKLKDLVNESLVIANYKILVIIDDIDRLDKNEIYTILKLIKLNANFKNFIYLITLDSEQVAKAIGKRYGNKKKDGLLFLEKIINIPIQLPRIEEEDLKKYFEEKLYRTKTLIEFADKDKVDKEFKEIVFEYRKTHFKSPREIIRVLNSFFIGLYSIPDDVNIRDRFWIEYIKIKNEKCYSFLKNIETDFFSNGLNSIIDFKNELNKDENTRMVIFDSYKDVSDVLDLLFPLNSKSGELNFNSKQINPDISNQELRIHHVDHYDKYFSYHLEGKISEKDLIKIKQLIKDENRNELKETLTKFLIEIDNYKKLYKIEDLIENLKIEDGRDFFFKYIITNINLIPFDDRDVFGTSYHNRIIELIASILNKNKSEEEIILSIAKILNTTQLCHFTRKFDNNEFKLKLEELIVEKLKKEVKNENKPFFENPYDMSNKMKMHYWHKYDKEGFEQYINEMTDNKENIKLLIRNFPSYWNNEYFGGIEIENYIHIGKLLNVNLLYSKIKEFYPEIVSKVDTKYLVDNYKKESTIEENLEEFVYFYKKENKAW